MLKFANKNHSQLHQECMDQLQNENVLTRIHEKDSSLWTQQADVKQKIDQRLGWTEALNFIDQNMAELHTFSQKIEESHFDTFVWIGMGGSSLFAKTLVQAYQAKNFFVLDTTDPATLKRCLKNIHMKNTLFFVASKSGGTLETLSIFDYLQKNGLKKNQSIAISDPGTALSQDFKKQAEECFASFVNPSDIGGRFSALSFFGLIPFMLISRENLIRNIQSLREQLNTEAFHCEINQLSSFIFSAYKNHAANKLVMHLPKTFQLFTHWVEQLVAESTGKSKQGFMPIPSDTLNHDRNDCMHIIYTPKNEDVLTSYSMQLPLQKDTLLLNAYLWMAVTAELGYFLKLNPFDEPNVTVAKQNTQHLLGQMQIDFPEDSVSEFNTALKSISSQNYLAVLYYGDDQNASFQEIKKMQEQWLNAHPFPCVIYPGPQYLHSVGQYFKGGHNDVMYLCLHKASAQKEDEKSLDRITYAQAVGDYHALKKLNRNAYIFSVDSFLSTQKENHDA